MADNHNESAGRQLGIAILQGIGAGLLLSLVFAAGFLYSQHLNRTSRASTTYNLLPEIEGLLASHYLYDLPDASVLIHAAAEGMVEALQEPNTYFVEPQTAEIDSSNLAGRFGGIGAEIARDELGRFVIVTVYRDNPAEAAGVQAGDLILAVDGVAVDTAAPNMNALLAAVRGEIGDPVTLTLQRGYAVFDVEIVRAEVLVPAVFWRVLEEDPRVGYIQITRFTERAPEEAREAIRELQQAGVSAFILDLRSNGGGLVDAAVKVTDEFLSGGVILYEERQGAAEKVFNASRRGLALNEPLVLLVNRGSASASEIVAGALRDRERAVLVGETTYGKGTVQLIFSLSDGSSLHVTTAEWYTPGRTRIEGQGITPDIPVPPSEGGSDTALKAALDYLAISLPVAAREP